MHRGELLRKDSFTAADPSDTKLSGPLMKMKSRSTLPEEPNTKTQTGLIRGNSSTSLKQSSPNSASVQEESKPKEETGNLDDATKETTKESTHEVNKERDGGTVQKEKNEKSTEKPQESASTSKTIIDLHSSTASKTHREKMSGIAGIMKPSNTGVGLIPKDPKDIATASQAWFWIERLRSRTSELQRACAHLDLENHKVRKKEPILRHDESPDNPYAKFCALQKKSYVPNVAKIRTKVIVIAGLGSVGATIGEHLTRIGAGKLILIDKGRVENAHLGSLFYCPKHVGYNKVDSFITEMKLLNPDVHFKGFVGDVANAFVTGYNNSGSDSNILTSEPIIDVVVSCLDSYESRLLIAKYCLEKELTLIDAFVSCSAQRAVVRVNPSLSSKSIMEEATSDRLEIERGGPPERVENTRVYGKVLNPSANIIRRYSQLSNADTDGSSSKENENEDADEHKKPETKPKSSDKPKKKAFNYGCPVHLGSTDAVVAGVVIQKIVKLLMLQIQPMSSTTYNALTDRFEVLPMSYKPAVVRKPYE